MILKKKEVIAASLVVLIGVAGYLNWSYQDTIRVQDGESYEETGKKLGEAQYVNAVDEVEESTEPLPSSSANTSEETASEQTGESEKDEENTEETSSLQDENEDNSQSEQNEGYFEQAKLNKEASRSKSLEILNQTAENESFDSEIRKKAGDRIIAIADDVQKESEIENIAQSKGYGEICVYVDENNVNVSVRKENFGDEDALKLTSIVTEQMKISAQNVKIVEVK